MKKTIRIAVLTTIILCMLSLGFPAYAASVRVSLPTFPITLNGKQIENDARQYPLIVYKDITYFPMTYFDCRFLGLESDYTAEAGLTIKATGEIGTYNEYAASVKNPQTGSAQTASFPIHVNGKAIDNGQEEYPLLLYRDITYFPLTWRFAYDAFGWEYYWDTAKGLMIYSFDPENAEEVLKTQYGDQAGEIVREAANKMKTSEWLSLTFRTYSRYQNTVSAILNLHPSSGTKWYKQVRMIDTDQYDNSKNPTIAEQYLLFRDRLYHSLNGKDWRSVGDADFAFPEFPDLTQMMELLLENSMHDGWWRNDEGYPCLVLGYADEEPFSLPTVNEDGSTSVGGIHNHRFYFDLQERCLRSYWVYDTPLLLGDDGEVLLHAPSTTFYSVIDFDYQAVTMPSIS